MSFEIVRFLPGFGLPSASPFCVKLEAWCRIAGLAYETTDLDGLPKSKTGKLPYIIDDGELIPDSQQVIDHLKKTREVDPDAVLDAGQRATGHAIRRMLEESLYWAIVYDRWMVDENWKLTRAEYFRTLPALAKPFAPAILRRGVRKSLAGQGYGRRTEEMKMRVAREDLSALSTALGAQEYMLGQCSSIDASALAMLWSIDAFPGDSSLKRLLHEFDNLVSYQQRLRAELFEV